MFFSDLSTQSVWCFFFISADPPVVACVSHEAHEEEMLLLDNIKGRTKCWWGNGIRLLISYRETTTWSLCVCVYAQCLCVCVKEGVIPLWDLPGSGGLRDSGSLCLRESMAGLFRGSGEEGGLIL